MVEEELHAKSGAKVNIIIKLLGFCLSTTIIYFMVIWTIQLCKVEIEDLPVISVLNKDFKIPAEENSHDGIENLGLSINKSQIVLNKTLKTLSFEDVSIKLHPEVYIKLKLNIARSTEEAKEQSKSGKAIITTEITGGDIRSARAQKDAKRFEKKNDNIKIDKTPKEVLETDNTKTSKKLENKDQDKNKTEKEDKEEE